MRTYFGARFRDPNLRQRHAAHLRRRGRKVVSARLDNDSPTVARAVARSCANVSQLLLKLRRPLLSSVIVRLFQKRFFSGSSVGDPQRFQISATRMPQAVARAVARSCVVVSRLLPKSRAQFRM